MGIFGASTMANQFKSRDNGFFTLFFDYPPMTQWVPITTVN